MKLNNHFDHNKLKKFLNENRFNFYFIITGKKSFKKSNFFNLFLQNSKKNFFIYYKDNINYCHTKELKKIIKKVNVYNPDLILAIGGGTVIDYGKMASIVWKNNNNKNITFRTKNILEKKYLTLMIPTTAGSGSEVTSFAAFYEKNKKFSIESSLLTPDYFFLVPELLLNSPRKVRAASGFDAISQSIESIFSKKSNNLSLKYSIKSLNYSLKNFLNFVNKPNVKNITNMQLAANYSGKAINIAKTNVPHALSYFSSYHYKMLHGLAVSVFFLNTIIFFYNSIKNKKSILFRKFSLLFKAMKIKNIEEFRSYFIKILLKSGIYKNLYPYKKKIDNNINKLIFSVNKERLNNSPIRIGNNDLRTIIFKSLN
jgi:alcohol dehydrogenase class IV